MVKHEISCNHKIFVKEEVMMREMTAITRILILYDPFRYKFTSWNRYIPDCSVKRQAYILYVKGQIKQRIIFYFAVLECILKKWMGNLFIEELLDLKNCKLEDPIKFVNVIA